MYKILHGIILTSLLLNGSACSLVTTDVTPCDSDEQCRSRFGLRSTCASDGFCEQQPLASRCANTFPSGLLDGSPTDAIVFGSLVDRSLDTQRARERATRLAISQINDEGGLTGRDFALVACTIEQNAQLDQDSREDAAVATANYLVDALGVSAIIGPSASGDVQATFLSLQDKNTLLISPAATSPALTALEPDPSDMAPGLLWRTAAPDSIQGAVIAKDMLDPGTGRSRPAKKVAAIYESGAYGEGLYLEFARQFTAGGGEIRELPYDSSARRDEHIAAAGLGDAEEVLFVSSQANDVIAFLNATATLSGYDDKGLFLTDSAANADVLDKSSAKRQGQIRATRPAPLDQASNLVYASFLAAYAAAYDGEDARRFSFTAHAYDATWLAAYGAAWALQQTGSLGGLAMAQGLRMVSSGDSVDVRPTTWNAVVQKFRSKTGVNLDGASGPLDYDPRTEETSGGIQVWRVENRKIVGIETWSP